MRRFHSIYLALCVGFGGCAADGDSPSTLTLATTTSTRDSGLLDVLVPAFEKQTGTRVKVVAVGSGQALAMGKRGDADLLLVHAPDAEQRFVDQEHGIERRPVMHNDFVLVGPPDDPAGVKGASSIRDAFAKIRSSGSLFISRGDESGTHMKEQAIWRAMETEPEGPWYVQAGSGMAATLRMAHEKRAYTLADRGTYLAHRDLLDLAILSHGDTMLHNPYATILVNPDRHPHIHAVAARQFADFLRSDAAQRAIADFGVEKYGEPLFFPLDSAGRHALDTSSGP